MSRARALFLSSLSVAFALPIASCLLGGFERVDTDPGSGGGSATSGSGSGGGDAGTDASTCSHVTPPGPPSVKNAGGNIDFVTAVHAVGLGEQSGSPPIGFDLDRYCTCEGDPPSCQSPKKATTCDEKGGIDDAAVLIVKGLQVAYGGSSSFGSTYFSNKADAGYWSLLVRVRNYNGMMDDDQVEVDLYPAAGSPTTTPPNMPPQWNGTDEWPVATSSLSDGATIDSAKYSDKYAYVTGGQLVASIPSSAITLSGGVEQIELFITGGSLVATIKPVPGSPGEYGLTNGTIGGRWALSDMFKMLSSFRSNSGEPICIGDPLYGIAKSTVCSAPDILAGVGSPTQPCDAISFAMTFNADPAKLGSAVPSPTPMKSCAQGTDPAMDSCF